MFENRMHVDSVLRWAILWTFHIGDFFKIAYLKMGKIEKKGKHEKNKINGNTVKSCVRSMHCRVRIVNWRLKFISFNLHYKLISFYDSVLLKSNSVVKRALPAVKFL